MEDGCPNLSRKAVNSAKRLRAHVQLDEGDVCILLCNIHVVVHVYDESIGEKIYTIRKSICSMSGKYASLPSKGCY